MRLDRGRPEIRSISYSNRLLIDFCDSNPAVRFTRRDDPIRNLGSNSNLTTRSRSEFESKFNDLLKMVKFDQKLSIYIDNWSNYIENDDLYQKRQ